MSVSYRAISPTRALVFRGLLISAFEDVVEALKEVEGIEIIPEEETDESGV